MGTLIESDVKPLERRLAGLREGEPYDANEHNSVIKNEVERCLRLS